MPITPLNPQHQPRAWLEVTRRVLGVGLLVLLLPTAAHAAPTAPIVPTTLQVPDEHVMLFRVFAEGTQDYACVRSDTGVTSWAFRQPRATLTTDDGEVLGIHGRGPFWAAYDGSRVSGSAPISAPAADASRDIPWLLLRSSPDETDGRLASVSYIQRLDTQGGVAPTGACDPDQEPTIAVPYTAVYYFYAPGPPQSASALVPLMER